jgi:FkbM family methyltransferase
VKRVATPTPLLERLFGFLTELRGANRFVLRARPRYYADAVAYRILKFVRLPASGRMRTLQMIDGTLLSYRLNRGDIQAIREIWLSQTYSPPLPSQSFGVFVDLGANIGFTTLYFARRYGAHTCVAVEPDPDNARLLRHNLAQNGIRATIFEAAVGPRDGSVRFAQDRESNLGRVAAEGVTVPMVSMDTVVHATAHDRVDLLKMDIEGGEAELFAGPTGWLDTIDAIMMEFHPDVADPNPILSTIKARGFRHIRAGSIREGSTDAFVR